MVLFREKACREIMTIMAEDGAPLPRRCEKDWLHTDEDLVEDLNLYFILCFSKKLDLRFSDPIAPNRYHGPRKAILAQRGLSPLCGP
jgi:hypothetical protein